MSPAATIDTVQLGDFLIVPGNLLPGVRASLVWLEKIESEVPALKEPFGVLREAASGRRFRAVDFVLE